MTPRIFTQFDVDTDTHVLMCESHGAAVPAGPRLFRAPPHPRIKFQHETHATAEADAQAMRQYLAQTSTKTTKSKQRKEGA